MSRTATQVFLIVYFAVQLVLPLRAFVHDKLETAGELSWNMYSQRYTCRVRYELVRDDGTRERLHHKQHFARAKRAMHVMHRDTLPELHRYLCERYGARGDLGRIEARVSCSVNDGPRRDLVERGVDICRAPAWGVLER